ncbi:hypothetical protein ACOKFD_15625 [Flagellimonas sp. S174]|uniref:hypothetical protein n=1 Tax=Flagellimonas sp. S174 TaxID=3410790 RepID=UPI003BF53B25
MERRLSKLGKNVEKVGKNLTLSVTAPLAGVAAQAVKSASDLEVLDAKLLTVFQGNEAAAKSAFSEIIEFTSNTPFQLEQVADGFVKLKNLGLDPSIASLESYGNTAAALGKDLNQFIEAVADASVNEFERLKEFGIKSRQEGENVRFTFQGITTTVRKNAEEIQEFLQQIGNTTFAGSIEKQAQTFRGALSTIRDNLKLLLADFGEIIIEGLRPLIDRGNQLIKVFRELSPETKAQILAFAGFAASIGPLILLAGSLTTSIAAITGAIRALTLAVASNPFGAIATAVAAAAVGFGIYNKILKETQQITEDLNDVNKIAEKNTAKEIGQVQSLVSIAKSERVSKEERLKAIRELNKISPEYLGNLTLETINTDKARESVEEYTKVILENATVKAAQSKLEEIQTKIIEEQLGRAREIGEAERRRAEFIQIQQERGKSYTEAVQAANNALEVGNFLSDKKLERLEEEKQLLLDIIANSDTILDQEKKRTTDDPVNPLGISLEDIEVFDPAEIDALIAELGGNVDRALEDAAVRSFQIKLDGISLEGTDNESVFGISDEDVDSFLQRLENIREVSFEVARSISGVFQDFSANLVGSLGLAESGFEGFVKNLAQTVAQLISILLSNSIANAISGATQSALATGPGAIFSQPAFIATAVSGVLSAFAAIPKFADGGIVPGNSFFGDRLVAGVNSGELILNIAQQRNLANALVNEPVIIGGDFVLEGDTVRLMLERNGKKIDRRT